MSKQQVFTIKDLPANITVTPDTKCDYCKQSICCTYVTQEIDAPKSMKDYDYLLWLISHRDVSVFKDDDGWFMSAANSCTHLLPNGNCGIYHTRPEICRTHSNESCEFDGPAEDDFKKFFDNYKTLDEFCRKKFKNWDARFEKWAKKKAKKKR